MTMLRSLFPTSRTLRSGLLLACAALLVIVSEGGTVTTARTAPATEKELTLTDWKRLQSLRIYFGHQSVGLNILEGLDLLTRGAPERRLLVRKIGAPGELDGPMLAHSFIGENGDPRSKMHAFQAMMQNGIGDHADLALFKFCYVDVTAYTDVDALFAEYQALQSELKRRYPRVVLVHGTVPLTVTKTTVRSLIKSVLGKEDNNVRRNRYNDLLRKHYSGREPVFDIARAESQKSDGSRSTFTSNGVVYESLDPDYSDDGGHLNDRGREAVARELLRVLRDHGKR